MSRAKERTINWAVYLLPAYHALVWIGLMFGHQYVCSTLQLPFLPGTIGITTLKIKWNRLKNPILQRPVIVRNQKKLYKIERNSRERVTAHLMIVVLEKLRVRRTPRLSAMNAVKGL